MTNSLESEASRPARNLQAAASDAIEFESRAYRTPRFSRLALFLKFAFALVVTLSGNWIWQVLPYKPLQAALIILMHILLPVVFLSIGIVATAIANHRDRPSASDLLTALWSEIRISAQVGLWMLPFRWRSFADSSKAEETSTGPVVIFVHGFFCNRGMWIPWLRHLSENGVKHISVNLEPLFGSIDDYVATIDAAVHQAQQLSNSKPHFVCHSMGGLVVRHWLVSHASARSRVDQVITIGSPHFGTVLSQFAPLMKNVQQMKTASQWLADLRRRELEMRPVDTYQGFICWYSNTDNVVLPSSSAQLPGADNRMIRGVGHLALAYHPSLLPNNILEPGPAMPS